VRRLGKKRVALSVNVAPTPPKQQEKFKHVTSSAPGIYKIQHVAKSQLLSLLPAEQATQGFPALHYRCYDAAVAITKCALILLLILRGSMQSFEFNRKQYSVFLSGFTRSNASTCLLSQELPPSSHPGALTDLQKRLVRSLFRPAERHYSRYLHCLNRFD
jgi:hypothetical protein